MMVYEYINRISSNDIDRWMSDMATLWMTVRFDWGIQSSQIIVSRNNAIIVYIVCGRS